MKAIALILFIVGLAFTLCATSFFLGLNTGLATVVVTELKSEMKESPEAMKVIKEMEPIRPSPVDNEEEDF